MRWMVWLAIAVCSPSPFAILLAQIEPPDTMLTPSKHVQTDTTQQTPDTPPLILDAADTLHPGFQPTKSAAVATILSAVIPGAGQVYNESYWKLPIVLGFGAYFAYEWLDNHKKYRDYRDQYRESLETFPSGDGRLLTLREFYKEQRDTFTWYFAILYLLNVADAYVDASLYDFSVGDDLMIRFVPDRRPGLRMRVEF